MSPSETQLESNLGKQPRSTLPALHSSVFCSAFPGASGTEQELGSIVPHSQSTGLSPRSRQIERRLLELGIPPHIKGFSYIREAVKMLIDSESKIFGITKILYPDIAKLYGTTSTRVERAIRHAIELSWARHGLGDGQLFASWESKPSNAEFLAFLSRSISLELNP